MVTLIPDTYMDWARFDDWSSVEILTGGAVLEATKMQPNYVYHLYL